MERKKSIKKTQLNRKKEKYKKQQLNGKKEKYKKQQLNRKKEKYKTIKHVKSVEKIFIKTYRCLREYYLTVVTDYFAFKYKYMFKTVFRQCIIFSYFVVYSIVCIDSFFAISDPYMGVTKQVSSVILYRLTSIHMWSCHYA